MKIDIFNEIHWLRFRKLPKINNLPLHEQVKQYNLYIDELTFQRNSYLHWLEGHKKGRRIASDLNAYLLQENDFFILQQDGEKIKL